MKLTELYKAVLSMAGMVADDEGFVSDQVLDERIPTTIKGKRLVLPTDNQLRTTDLTGRLVFHPLIESASRGESEVMACFRERLNKRLNFVLSYVGHALLVLATSPAEHKKLTPDQTEFLRNVKDADEGVLEAFQALTKPILAGDLAVSFVHLFVKKNGTANGRKHLRVGTVSFPLYEELIKPREAKGPNKVFGTKMRKVDRETLIGLMTYLLANVDKPDLYMRPSNSDVAPTLDSLLKAGMAVADQINSIIDMFSDYIEGGKELKFDFSWDEVFNDPNAPLKLSYEVPMQRGNEGSIPMTETRNNVITVQDSPVRESTSAPADIYAKNISTPAPAPAPAAAVPATTSGGVDFRSFMNGHRPHHSSVLDNTNHSGVVVGSGGVDFRSVMQNNQALAGAVGYNTMQFGGGGYGGYGMPQQQQPRTPGWARGNVAPVGGYGGGYGGGGYGGSSI